MAADDEWEDEDTEETVFLSQTCHFDFDTNEYVYDVETTGITTIRSNVFDGMYTKGPVYVKYPVGATVIVYRNGSNIDSANLEQLTAPGSYIVYLQGVGNTVAVLQFVIVGDYSTIEEFVAPAGFSIADAYCNEEEIDFSLSRVSMQQEGSYIIEYVCTATGVAYSFWTTIDHTPPQITLSGVVNGIAKSSVQIRDVEDDVSLYIEKNGQMYIPNGDTLNDVAYYHILATDGAGNTTEYNFEIRVHLDAVTVIFIIVFIIMIAALIAYIFVQRNKMRIR